MYKNIFIFFTVLALYTQSLCALEKKEFPVKIPSDLGSVEHCSVSNGNRFVIHIQDAHCYYPVQQQIIKIIEYLSGKYSIRNIFVEGADSKLNANQIKSCPDKDIRKLIADYFLKEGKISGVEYLMVEGETDYCAMGVEDRELYRRNYSAFTESLGLSEEVSTQCVELEKQIDSAKSKFYSKELFELDKNYCAYINAEMTLRSFALFLIGHPQATKINPDDFENLKTLKTVLELEKKLDYSAIEIEKNRLILSLQHKLTPEEKIKLLDATLNYSLEKISSLSLFKLLLEYSKSAEIPMGDYPSLKVYINYLDESDKISATEIDNEIAQIVETLKSNIFINEDEKTISRIDKFVKTLKNIAGLRAGTRDLDFYQSEKQFFIENAGKYLSDSFQGKDLNSSILNKMSRFDNFYKFAVQRDSILVEKTISNMDKSALNSAVLITGGFHSDGIKNKFADKGISYISVKPKFFFSSQNNFHNYESVILGVRNSLENYLLTQLGSLAVANILVEGTPLVQEWKSGVYNAEMNLSVLAAKMAAVKLNLQTQMGIKPGAELSDAILNTLGSRLGDENGKFLSLWNNEYKKITAEQHPFLENIETDLKTVGGKIFLNIKIGDKQIVFPLNDRYTADPESIINSFLTPEKFASIIAGEPVLRESVDSIEQLRNLRNKVNDILLNPNSFSDQITEEEKKLIYSIAESILQSKSTAEIKALEDFNKKTARDISEIINLAVFNDTVGTISGEFAEKLTYSQLLSKIKYGSMAPTMIFAETMKDSQPVLSDFAQFVCNRFGLFSETKTTQDIRLVLDELLRQYLVQIKEVSLADLNGMIMDRFARMIHISLKMGDGIRPHGIVAVFKYAFNLMPDFTFEEGMLIHDLLERESIYTEDQVIQLMLNSTWINEKITRILISKPIGYEKLLELIKSDELRYIRQSPTPLNFSRFNKKYSQEFGELFSMKIFSESLDESQPLKKALEALIAEGYKNDQKINQFVNLAIFHKNRYLKTKEDRFNFDLVILDLTELITREMLLREKEVTWGMVTDFAKIDSNSPDYDEIIFNNFFNQADVSGYEINMMSYGQDKEGEERNLTTPLGLETSPEQYRSMLGNFIQSTGNPVILFTETGKINEVKQWLDSMNLNILVVVVPFDYKKKDIDINWKKRLDFLGYWYNLSEVLSKKFRGRLRIVGFDDYDSNHYDSFGRDYFTTDHLIAGFGNPTDKELLQIAANAKTDILLLLSNIGFLNKNIVNEIIENKSFNPDVLSVLLKNNSITFDDDIIGSISKRLYTHQISEVFSSVQNMRSAMLFCYMAKNNPKFIGSLIGQMDNDKIINLLAHALKLGFQFNQETLPDNLSPGKMQEFVENLGAINPESAAKLVKTVCDKNQEKGRELIEKFSHDIRDDNLVKNILLNLINVYSESYPDFQELIPFLESDVTPLWHKGFVISNALLYLDKKQDLHKYIYAILDVFNEQGDFTEWIQLNILKHNDRVEQWMKVVSIFPEIDELRTTRLLKSAIMTDKHILAQYSDFIYKMASGKDIYSSLLSDREEFNLIFHAVNAVFSLPIETKMYVFNIIPFIKELLPEGMTFARIFNEYLEKTDQAGNVVEKGIPISCILQSIVFSEGDRNVLDSLKQMFSSSYISESTSVKNRLASNYLRVFAEYNQSQLYSSLKLHTDNRDQFIELIRLSTSQQRRDEIYNELKLSEYHKKRLMEKFDKTSRKRLIAIKSANYSKQRFTKKDQKALIDVIDFMLILNDNYPVLQHGDQQAASKFNDILKRLDEFENVQGLRTEIMKVFVRFIRLDFPDLFKTDDELITRIDKIEEVKNYWKYKLEWDDENQRGIDLMRKAVEGYLRDGSSLKSIKYGGTPQTEVQLKIVRELIKESFKKKYLQDGLTEEESSKKADSLASMYIATWKRDSSSRIDLRDFGALKRNETIVAWTSDEVPDWLRFGLSGGGTCLAPGNTSVYTKNLPGYMFSALVSGGLYFGKYKGDSRDRVNQALMPVEVSTGNLRLFVVNQYYYSSGGEIAEDIGIASVIAAIRNAGLYGADGVVIPVGSPQFGYLNQMKEFLKNEFSTVIDNIDESGKLVSREKITISSMDSEDVKMVVPEEPNRWRYFDATDYVYGEFSEKMNENFSYVDFENAAPISIAGIQFKGLTITSKAVVIHINRNQIPVEKTEVIEDNKPVPDAIIDLMKQDKLVVIGEKVSEVKDYLSRISRTDRTTGKYLNLVLQVSELLSKELNSKYVQRNFDSQYVVLSIANNGLPVARKIGEMLDGLDYVNGQISNKGEKDYIPELADTNKPRKVFLVDEAITTGNTAVKNIEMVLEKGICMPEEIVLVALTADPQAVEKLLRKYPDIKVVVGLLEYRTEQNGMFVSELLGGLTEKTQPLEIIAEKKVKVGGIEYKILDQFQRGQSFVVYTAETPAGSKVILKTTVSEDEGARFKMIWELVSNNKPELGVPQVHQYDEKTGVLVSSFISGTTLANYIRQEGKSPFELTFEFLNAIHDVLEVADFLNQHNAQYVNITLNNLRKDPSNGKWYLTNYTPFPYRMKPLPESGVVSQLGFIIEQVINHFNSFSGTFNDDDRKIVSNLETLLTNIKSGKIDSITSLNKGCSEIFISYLNTKSIGNMAKINLESYKEILDTNNYRVMDKIYRILRSNKYYRYHIEGVLNLLNQFTDMTLAEKQVYILEKLEGLLDGSLPELKMFGEAGFLYIDIMESDMTSFMDTSERSDQIKNITGGISKNRDALQAYVQNVIKSLKSGQPVFLTGNYDAIKYVYNEIYAKTGRKPEKVFIIPDFITKGFESIPAKFAKKPVLNANQLFFGNTYKKEGTELIVTESTLFDLPQISALLKADDKFTDELRLRIINNPGMNLILKTTGDKIIGLVSFALVDGINPQTNGYRWKTTPNSKMLVNYSSFIKKKSVKAKYEGILTLLEKHLASRFQTNEIYRYYYPQDYLQYMISQAYYPFIKNGLVAPFELFRTAFADNNPQDLIQLFPKRADDKTVLLNETIGKLWNEKSKEYKNILSRDGEKTLTVEITRDIAYDVCKNNPNISPEQFVTDFLGLKLSVFDYISSSILPGLNITKNIDALYEEYLKNVSQINPDIEEMSKDGFEQIVKLPTGSSAFKNWIEYHNHGLVMGLEKINSGSTTAGKGFTEEFGIALSQFVRLTGRRLVDSECEKNILNDVTLSMVIKDGWSDPISITPKFNGLGYGLVSKFTSYEFDDTDYLLNNFSEEIEKKLRDFLSQLSDSERSQLIINLNSINFNNDYKQTEYIINMIFASSLGKEEKLKMLLSPLAEYGQSIQSVYGDNRVVFVNADFAFERINIHSIIANKSTIYLFTGSYENVMSLYNQLNDTLSKLDAESIKEVKNRVSAFLPFVYYVPDQILGSRRGHLFNFGEYENSIAIQRIKSMPFLPDKIHFIESSNLMFRNEDINIALADIMGTGGMLRLITSRYNRKIEDLRNYSINVEKIMPGFVFLRLNLEFEDKKFESLIRFEIKNRSQLKTPSAVTMETEPAVPFGPGTKIINSFAIKHYGLNADMVGEFIFYEQMPVDNLSVNDTIDIGKIEKFDSGESIPARKLVRIQSGLWLKYGLVPEIKPEYIIFDNSKSDLYLLASFHTMTSVARAEDMFFNLIKQKNYPFAIAKKQISSWMNGKDTPFEVKREIFDGILDGFNGDIKYFKLFADSVIKSDQTKNMVNAITEYTKTRLKYEAEDTSFNQSMTKIHSYLSSVFSAEKEFVLDGIRNLPEFSSNQTAADDIIEYSNRLIRDYKYCVKSLNAYLETLMDDYQHIDVLNAIKAMEEKMKDVASSTLMVPEILAAKNSDANLIMGELGANTLLKPSQLIKARISISREIYSPTIKVFSGKQRVNPLHNQAIYNMLAEIEKTLNENPDGISKVIASLSTSLNISEDFIYSLMLPKYDPQTKSFELGKVNVSISALTQILKVETILREKPLLVAGDSSSLNFQVFDQIRSIFKLPSVEIGYNYEFKNWIGNQSGSYSIDLADDVNTYFIDKNPDALLFDLRKYSSIENFLKDFVFQFDSDNTDRVSFYINKDILEVSGIKNQAVIDDILRKVLKLKLSLNKMLSGDIAARKAFYEQAKLLGLMGKTDEIIYNAQIQSQRISITEMIFDGIRQSNKFPELNEFMTKNYSEGNFTDRKLLILLDVYSNLAINYFARQLSGFASEGELTIDFDIGTVEVAGKKLIEFGEDHKFVLELFRSAKIGYKTFKRGTPVETIISFTQTVKKMYPLFSEDLMGNIKMADSYPGPNTMKQKLMRKIRYQSLMESSV